jgi:hypothetical protein
MNKTRLLYNRVLLKHTQFFTVGLFSRIKYCQESGYLFYKNKPRQLPGLFKTHTLKQTHGLRVF